MEVVEEKKFGMSLLLGVVDVDDDDVVVVDDVGGGGGGGDVGGGIVALTIREVHF